MRRLILRLEGLPLAGGMFRRVNTELQVLRLQVQELLPFIGRFFGKF